MWRRSLEDWLATTSLSGFNQFYIEQLYEQFSLDPSSVDPKWADLFRDLESGSLISQSRYYDSLAAKEVDAAALLVAAYRNHGHLLASLDPLAQWHRNPNIPFNLVDYNLHPDQEVKLLEPVAGKKKYFAGDLFLKLKELYTGNLGYEFSHIADIEQREWWIAEIEAEEPLVSGAEREELLSRLVRAELLEKALANKFPGAKRFSLEGTETFINLLDQLFVMASDNNYRELYLSMAHRGRLNALVNNFALAPSELYQYFEGKGPLDDSYFNDDVKYHLGRSARFTKSTVLANPLNKIVENQAVNFLDVHLCYNPSHLEFANAICLGSSRAAQDIYNLEQQPGVNLVLPVLVHGDSAVSGQGIVQEMLNFSNTRGFSVGGAIHIVINNQIGFTTSNRKDTRSSTYCTDIAKMVEAPVIHVNSEDPLAVVKAATLAFKYRQRFHRDVFIDLVGYRRLGHNEGDDPTVTQPRMYALIRQKELISTYFAQSLEAESYIDSDYLPALRKSIYLELTGDDLPPQFANLRGEPLPSQSNFPAVAITKEGRPFEEVEIELDAHRLQQNAQRLAEIPQGLEVSPTVAKLYQKRQENASSLDGRINWGEAELLAYATLMEAGKNVRLTGEDSGRGTFFHRVAVLHDANKEQEVIPMLELATENNRSFEVWDSTLSEAGVMGFEYGYSVVNPDTLTLWEAQFGDFANGAQVIIDQFLCSGETKWNQVSGLTLLLPHGYEGQGPEHSSGRIERFLQLCANNNMRVVVPTSPKQVFHLLLNQGLTESKKPLVIFTPKSLLRSDLATSSFKELANQRFSSILNLTASEDEDSAQKVEKLLLTNGRIRFDVEKVLAENNNFAGTVVASSVEELYPWPGKELASLVASYPNLKVIEWVQDEPENQGSWSYAFPLLLQLVKDNPQLHLNFNGRPPCATTAAGYGKLHQSQLAKILANLASVEQWII